MNDTDIWAHFGVKKPVKPRTAKRKPKVTRKVTRCPAKAVIEPVAQRTLFGEEHSAWVGRLDDGTWRAFKASTAFEEPDSLCLDNLSDWVEALWS